MAKKDFITSQETHEFAVFYENKTDSLATQSKEPLWLVRDELLVHRLLVVLRLSVGDSCIIFDQKTAVRFVVDAIHKKSITLRYVAPVAQKHTPTCHIRVLLPLLKREALENALYNLVEMGVSEIIFVVTARSRKEWSLAQEPERLRRIYISAMEQAKHFSWPMCTFVPVLLEQYIEKNLSYDLLFYADPCGKPLSLVLNSDLIAESSTITLLVGPESGLVAGEQEVLEKCFFKPVALTSGILRAQQAVTIFAGIFCAWYSRP